MNVAPPSVYKMIDTKLALSFGALVLFLMLLVTGTASYLYARLQEQEEDQLARTEAITLSKTISRISFSGKHHARLLVEEMKEALPSMAFISVESTNGIILAHSNRSLNDTPVAAQERKDPIPSKPDEALIYEHRHNQELIKEVIVPYEGGIDNRIIGVVRVGIRVQESRKDQQAALFKLLVLGALLTVAAMWVVHTLSRRFGGEVRTLAWQLQGVLDHAALAIVISDASDRIHVRSAEFDRMFGSDHEYLQERFLAQKLPQTVMKTLSLMDSEVFAKALKVENEMTVDMPGKSTFWHVSKSPIARDDMGNVSLISTVIWDVTEQRRMQEQLRQSQKMDAVGQLAGGIAHDFNNKLQIILGYTSMALEETDPKSSVHENLVEVKHAAEHSAELTRQLLAFARKQTVSPVVLDLDKTVSGMMRMLMRLIGENITLNFLPGHNLWLIRMDPSQLDQILANLTVNARDAISRNGVVTIETGNATFDAFNATHPDCIPGDYVMLSVQDNGCGMDKETLTQVFEPFFTTKGIGRGTGLGLATVYGIVKQNKGFIEVRSQLGNGTLFRIFFPRFLGSPAESSATQTELKLLGGRETLLLVEDEPSILNLGKAILEPLGYTVLTAQNPKDAIRLAASHPGPIPLLITDVVMPGMNGRELAEHLATIRPAIKFLFMSGYTANIIENQGVFEAGLPFVHKPFTAKMLADKIREVLDHPSA